MMEYDELDLDQDIASVNVDLEFYMKHREVSIPVHMKVPLTKGGPISTIADLMDYSYQQLMVDVDSKSQRMLVLEDQKHNHYCFLVEDIQAFNIMAPDKMPDGFEDEE